MRQITYKGRVFTNWFLCLIGFHYIRLVVLKSIADDAVYLRRCSVCNKLEYKEKDEE